MPEEQKTPNRPQANRRPAAGTESAGQTKVPAHKKIYGAESDVIDSVVRSVKRDSAQRGAGDDAATAQRKKQPAGQQRRASSGKSFRPHMDSKFEAQWNQFMDVFRRFRAVTVVILALVLVISGIFMDAQSIDVAEQTLTVYGLAEELQGLKILHLSDLNSANFGDEQAQLMRKINTLSYDVVVLTGDMVGAENDPEQLYKLLDALPASKPVYFISGDADPGPFVDVARDVTGTLNQIVLEDWILGAMERGATYVDRPVSLQVGSATVWFTPADMLTTNLTETRSLYREAVEQQEEGVLSGIQADYDELPFTSYRSTLYDEAYKSAASMSDQDLHLSLAHVPPTSSYIAAMERGIVTENAEDVQLTRPDLILAGHYCNGVWRLPLIGALYVSSSTLPRNGWFPARNQVSGLRLVRDTPLYVNGGLSTNSDTPVMFARILNHPQISLITLTGELPESMLGD
ncbi:MAG: metallophosphoesterase [Clostridia bacterium]|nr:metallophosphoesterase [Clostridia bacterium]